MAPAGPLSVCRSRTPTGPVGGASLGKWCFEYPVNFRAPLACMAVSNTREEERHKQGGYDPVGVRPPDVQREARTSSWSVASVGPPAASGLSLGETYVATSVATNAHPRFQSLVHFSAIAQPQEDELLYHISSSSSARTERYDAFEARLRPAPEGLEAGCAEVREDWACSLVFLAWHRWARQRLSLLHLFRRSSRRDLSWCSSHFAMSASLLRCGESR